MKVISWSGKRPTSSGDDIADPWQFRHQGIVVRLSCGRTIATDTIRVTWEANGNVNGALWLALWPDRSDVIWLLLGKTDRTRRSLSILASEFQIDTFSQQLGRECYVEDPPP
jgi:hypothetical protein